MSVFHLSAAQPLEVGRRDTHSYRVPNDTQTASASASIFLPYSTSDHMALVLVLYWHSFTGDMNGNFIQMSSSYVIAPAFLGSLKCLSLKESLKCIFHFLCEILGDVDSSTNAVTSPPVFHFKSRYDELRSHS